MQNTFEKERILHKLMTAVGGREMRERVQAIAKARNIPEAAVLPYLADTYKLSLPPETSGTETLNQRMSAMIKQVPSRLCMFICRLWHTTCVCRL